MPRINVSESRSKRLKLIFNILIIVIIYMGARAWIQRDMASGTAPGIDLGDLSGNVTDWSAYRQQPVLLHFWATWCGVCAAERGVISAVNEDWQVLSVAMQSGSANEVADFMAEKQFSWRTINDTDGALSARFGVGAVPTSFIVKEGRIVFAQRGYITSVGLRLRLLAAKYLF